MTFRSTIARALVVGALVYAASPAVARAQFEGVITMKVQQPGGAAPMEIRQFVRGGTTRTEMTGPMGEMAMIADVTKGLGYMVLPARQTYMQMALPNQAQATERMRGAAVQPKVSRTGRKETIAGYSCEHWNVQVDTVSFDACMASGLPVWSSVMQGGGMGGRRGGGTGWLSMVGDGSLFPLRVTRTGSSVPMVEVTSIEKKTLSPALFTPPANFEKVEGPAGRGRP
jgi:hypothetical protein